MATDRKANKKLLYVNSLRNKDMNNSSYLLPHGEGDQVSMEFKILLYVILSKIAISFFIGFVLEITAFLKNKNSPPALTISSQAWPSQKIHLCHQRMGAILNE